MSKSEAVSITHSRTRCDLGKREGSCVWYIYICVLFHRWEEWWMDEVHSHCNGTLVYHGRRRKERVCLKKKKINLFNQGYLNEFLTIYPCCVSMISLQDWGRVNIRTESWRGVKGTSHEATRRDFSILSKTEGTKVSFLDHRSLQ